MSAEDFTEPPLHLIREAPIHVMWWPRSGRSWMSMSYADEVEACAQAERALFKGFNTEIWADE